MALQQLNRVLTEDREPEQVPASPMQPTRSKPPRLSTRKAFLTAATIVLLASVTVWWWTHRTVPVTYLTEPASRGAVARTAVATGTVNPQLTIIVGSYVSGVISDVYCDYNTRVNKGHLCAKIDPRPYQAALDQTEGQLARDSAQLAGARADLARYTVLWGQNSVAKQTYEDQDALVKELQGTLQLDRAAVETATVNLGYTNIVSPVDGTVVARNITIGQTVAASFQTPTLFLIATDLTKMEVDTNVSESDIGGVKLGDMARFTVEAFNDRTFQGTVAQVRQAPQSVQNVVTYDVVVDVDNNEFLLKPGMTATVQIVTEQHDNVLRVPDQALRFVPGGAHSAAAGSGASGSTPAAAPASAAASSHAAQVWLLRAGKATPVALVIGLDDDTNTEVLSGDLHSGDRLIIGEQLSRPAPATGSFHFGL